MWFNICFSLAPTPIHVKLFFPIGFERFERNKDGRTKLKAIAYHVWIETAVWVIIDFDPCAAHSVHNISENALKRKTAILNESWNAKSALYCASKLVRMQNTAGELRDALGSSLPHRVHLVKDVEPPVPTRGVLCVRDMLTRDVLQRIGDKDRHTQSVCHQTIRSSLKFFNGTTMIDRGLGVPHYCSTCTDQTETHACGTACQNRLLEEAVNNDFMPSRWQKLLKPLQVWTTFFLCVGNVPEAVQSAAQSGKRKREGEADGDDGERDLKRRLGRFSAFAADPVSPYVLGTKLAGLLGLAPLGMQAIAHSEEVDPHPFAKETEEQVVRAIGPHDAAPAAVEPEPAGEPRAHVPPCAAVPSADIDPGPGMRPATDEEVGPNSDTSPSISSVGGGVWGSSRRQEFGGWVHTSHASSCGVFIARNKNPEHREPDVLTPMKSEGNGMKTKHVSQEFRGVSESIKNKMGPTG